MEMFRGETSEVVRVLTENSVESVGEYPLIASGTSGKKFKVRTASCMSYLMDLKFSRISLLALAFWCKC